MSSQQEQLLADIDRARERAKRAEHEARTLQASVGYGGESVVSANKVSHYSNHSSVHQTPMQSHSLEAELASQRQLSEDRLIDIRKLQRQVNDLRNTQQGTGNESSLRAALLDERRRGDNERLIADERLDDIRRLQSKLNEVRSSQSSDESISLQLRQTQTTNNTLKQRESQLQSDIQKEMSSTARVTDKLRHSERELENLKQQYAAELSRHEGELKAWKRERREWEQRERSLASRTRIQEMELQKQVTNVVTDGKEREDLLRTTAEKEWGVAEDRLTTIRDLQTQLAAMHSKLSTANRISQDERERLLDQCNEEVTIIRKQNTAVIETLRAQLEEERETSSERHQSIQMLERHLKDLSEKLVELPESEDHRFNELHKQLDKTLTTYRREMDESTRRHTQEGKRLEKKVAAERALSEERMDDIREIQKTVALERSSHQQEMAEVKSEIQELAASHRRAEELLKKKSTEREEVLRKQIEIEKDTAGSRLLEIRQLQKKLQTEKETHIRELASQHDVRSDLVTSSRSKEEDHRKWADEMISLKETEFLEKERMLLQSKEQSVKEVIHRCSMKEERIRAEFEAKILQLKKQQKESNLLRGGEESRQFAELDKIHELQLNASRKRESEAIAQAEEAAQRAKETFQEAEKLKFEIKSERNDLKRIQEDSMRSQKHSIHDLEDKLESKEREVNRLKRDLETTKAQLQSVGNVQQEKDSQMSALEMELSRHVELLSQERKDADTTKVELANLLSKRAELEAEHETSRLMVNKYKTTVEQTKPELASLAADNCKLSSENSKLQQREHRLRQWAQQVVPNLPIDMA